MIQVDRSHGTRQEQSRRPEQPHAETLPCPIEALPLTDISVALGTQPQGLTHAEAVPFVLFALRGGHVGNTLTVLHVHGTLVSVHDCPEKVRSSSHHVSQAFASPDRGLTAADGVSAVCRYQPCTGTGGAVRDARCLTGLAGRAARGRRGTARSRRGAAPAA